MGPDRKISKNKGKFAFAWIRLAQGVLSVVIINVGINILSLHSKLLLGDPPYSSSKTGAFNLTQYRFNFLSGKSSPLFLSVLWVAFTFMFLGKPDQKLSDQIPYMKRKADACFSYHTSEQKFLLKGRKNLSLVTI